MTSKFLCVAFPLQQCNPEDCLQFTRNLQYLSVNVSDISLIEKYIKGKKQRNFDLFYLSIFGIKGLKFSTSLCWTMNRVGGCVRGTQDYSCISFYCHCIVCVCIKCICGFKWSENTFLENSTMKISYYLLFKGI